jgi:hypothetical protein
MNATTADWTHIEPLLDEAMYALDETDRVEPAAKCAEECFPEFHPVRVGLEILPPEYLPDLQKRGVWVGTNLTSEMTGIDTHVVNGLQEQLSFGLRE